MASLRQNMQDSLVVNHFTITQSYSPLILLTNCFVSNGPFHKNTVSNTFKTSNFWKWLNKERLEFITCTATRHQVSDIFWLQSRGNYGNVFKPHLTNRQFESGTITVMYACHTDTKVRKTEIRPVWSNLWKTISTSSHIPGFAASFSFRHPN